MTNKVSEIYHGTSYDKLPRKARNMSLDSPWLVLIGMKLVHHMVSLALNGQSSKALHAADPKQSSYQRAH